MLLQFLDQHSWYWLSWFHLVTEIHTLWLYLLSVWVTKCISTIFAQLLSYCYLSLIISETRNHMESAVVINLLLNFGSGTKTDLLKHSLKTIKVDLLQNVQECIRVPIHIVHTVVKWSNWKWKRFRMWNRNIWMWIAS